MCPLASALVKLVHLPPRLRRITQVDRLHLLRLDNNYAEVRSRDRVFEVLHLRSNSKVLVVVRLVHRLSGRWVLERA
jgi:hypothetical protein